MDAEQNTLFIFNLSRRKPLMKQTESEHFHLCIGNRDGLGLIKF